MLKRMFARVCVYPPLAFVYTVQKVRKKHIRTPSLSNPSLGHNSRDFIHTFNPPAHLQPNLPTQLAACTALHCNYAITASPYASAILPTWK